MRVDLLICIFLSLITFSVYWQVITCDFINYDDNVYVTENRHVKHGLSWESFVWSFSFTDKDKTYWHPLTWLSHILDCQLYGLNPGMHHLTSLIIHLANSVLLFLVFNRMTGAPWKSAFIAALFALHPINVDSVAWVAERKNVLSTFFWMLTILAYVYYTERPGFFRYLLTFLALLLGLLAKPMLITLPFVLLLLDYWPLDRLRHPTIPVAFRLVVEKVPFFFLAVFSIFLSTSSLERAGTMISTEQVPMDLRIANALVSYVGYIGKTLWPQNLAVHYPYPDTVPIWKAACSGLFLAVVSLAVLLVIKRKPYFSVGWLWFLGTLVPVIGLMQTGFWPAMADRWAYVPLIGLFIMIAWGAPEIAVPERHKKRGLVLTATTLLSILAVTVLLQVRYWADSHVLFAHTIEVTANNCLAHNNLGLALKDKGRVDEAIEHYSRALQILPSFTLARNNLGLALADQGRMDEAIRHYSDALRTRPAFAAAHNNLGNALAARGRLDEAAGHFSEALRIDPDFVKAYNNLGNVFFVRGNLDKALAYYSKALRIDRGYAEAHNGMGVVLANQGRTDEAIRHFSEALEIDPTYKDARNNLQRVLAPRGK